MESNKPVYDTVPLADEQYESRSSTEVDESVNGDECHCHFTSGRSLKRERRKACIFAFRSYLRIIDTLFLLVILSFLVILLLRDEHTGAQRDLRQVGGDYLGASPVC